MPEEEKTSVGQLRCPCGDTHPIGEPCPTKVQREAIKYASNDHLPRNSVQNNLFLRRT